MLDEDQRNVPTYALACQGAVSLRHRRHCGSEFVTPVVAGGWATQFEWEIGMRPIRSSAAGLALLGMLASELARAHGMHDAGSGIGSGIAHPLLGLDHVLAMVTVGLWAVQTGGRALWAVPATFVLMMGAGGALGMGGFALPMVEAGIATSVLVFGLLVALAIRLPLAAGMALAGTFALFHGFAHGAELPAMASPAMYAAGFLLATGLLHLTGVAVGSALHAWQSRRVRFAGACVTAAGLMLVAGL